MIQESNVQAHTSTISDEAEFGIEELFFSRTDKRGIIESGNNVFQRIKSSILAALGHH